MIPAGSSTRWIVLAAIVVGSCGSPDRDTDPGSPPSPLPSTSTDAPSTAPTTVPPTAPPPAPTTVSPPAPTIDDAVRRRLLEWYGPGPIGGAVATIGLAGGEAHTVAVGEAAPGVPARPGDTMRIGSITKTFMAALTLRLDEIGALDIDDAVADHLPDVGIDETVTIRRLLAHTSGIADPDPAELIALFREDSGRRFDFQDLMAFAEIPTSADERSRDFAYANAGYHVLGGVVEAATGTDVTTALRQHVFEPAGLANTHLAGAEEVPTAIVPGNVDLDGDGTEDPLQGVPYLAVETHAWTAGALVSTAEDLVAFARALFAGAIIGGPAVIEMTETSAAAHGHGLGIFDLGVEGATVYGNSGGGPGFHANFAHDPARGITAVVFTNCPSCATGGTDTWQLLVDLLDLAERGGA